VPRLTAEWIAEISIHALREEGDQRQNGAGYGRGAFLSTPSARRATQYPCTASWNTAFLSTPSARRATGQHGSFQRYVNISIHALREEGDGQHGSIFRYVDISIHALREEGDVNLQRTLAVQDEFLSTPSVRRATGTIHSRSSHMLYFYPRPP